MGKDDKARKWPHNVLGGWQQYVLFSYIILALELGCTELHDFNILQYLFYDVFYAFPKNIQEFHDVL